MEGRGHCCHLVPLRVRVEGILGGEHDAGHEDAQQHQVPEVGVVTQPVALQPETAAQVG